jgi:hypothetical protein
VVCCCFVNVSAFLYDMASRRVFDVDDIVSVLGDSNENLSYCNVAGVLFHDGSLLHSKFNTRPLITISNSSRILTHV